jgi:hypothetical protein
MDLLGDRALMAVQEMRLRTGTRIRYPDVLVCPGSLDQTTLTLTDAIAIFEVPSDDTATTDRVEKLIDYATSPLAALLRMAGTNHGRCHAVSARTRWCLDCQRTYRRGAGSAWSRHQLAARGSVSRADLRRIATARGGTVVAAPIFRNIVEQPPQHAQRTLYAFDRAPDFLPAGGTAFSGRH